MKKILLVLLAVLLLSGCTSQIETPVNEEIENSDSYYPVTITTYNFAKEPIEVTFDKAPEKVFAVYQNSIETLLALGLEDYIVAAAGLDQDVKPEYQDGFNKINYLTEFTPDKETVLMSQPDLILSWYSYFSEKNLGDVDFFHERNINTYIMQNSGAAAKQSLENEYTDILNLGKIFNVQEKAEEIVAQMKTKVETISSEAKKMDNSPRVLVMEFEKEGVRVYGENTLGGDMVKQLGAELVTANENKMSNEEFIQSNPEVIFTVYFGSSSSIADADAAIDKVVNDPRYQNLSAVQNNRVYAISLGEMYCSGTRTLDGILRLANGIYPEMDFE